MDRIKKANGAHGWPRPVRVRLLISAQVTSQGCEMEPATQA